MIRSIAAVLAGWLAYGLVCVPGNLALAGLMPQRFNADGTTTDSGALVGLLVLSVGYSMIAGFTTATIARRRELAHGIALAAWNLAFGLAVQLGYWELLPVWYHTTFLLLIPPGVIAGALARRANATSLLAARKAASP